MKLDYPIRLNSYLAKSGHGSRRHCETLIEERRVKVNHQIVDQLSFVVEKNDEVHVDDVLAKPLERGLYYALNKPVGYVSSNTDPFEKLYARDLLSVENSNYLFHVGRLDKESSGLIIFTNDGDFGNFVTHPSNEVEKEYEVTINKDIKIEDLRAALKGVKVYRNQGLYKIKRYKILTKQKILVTLTEGKNREIRKIFDHLGYKIGRLKRIRIGPIELGNLKEGRFKTISPHLIDALLGGKN